MIEILAHYGEKILAVIGMYTVLTYVVVTCREMAINALCRKHGITREKHDALMKSIAKEMGKL